MTTEFRHDRVAVYPSGNVVLAGNPRFARECESRGAQDRRRGREREYRSVHRATPASSRNEFLPRHVSLGHMTKGVPLMPPQITMRSDEDTLRRIAELAKIMGPVAPLTRSDVLRECVRRVHEIETKKKEKRR